MKIRRSIFWFIGICAVLMVLVVWLGKKPAETPVPTVAESDVAPQSLPERTVSEKSPRKPDSPAHTNAPAGQVAPTASTPPPPLKTKGEQMKEALADFNDEDVVLYGRVIDQLGAPVADATVAGNIQVNNGRRVGSDKISLATDANGMFTISGYKGKALGIWVT